MLLLVNLRPSLPVVLIVCCGLWLPAACTTDAPPPPGSVRLIDQQAVTLLQEGEKKENDGNLGGALSKYRRIVEKHSLSQQSAQARFRMAQVYEKRQDPIEAFEQYQKLIERHPDSNLYQQAIDRQKQIAFAAAQGKLTNKVLWLFDVSMDPMHVTKWLQQVSDNAPYAATAPQALDLLARYYVKRDQTKEAIDTYQTLVDKYADSPLAPAAQLQIANLYRQTSAKGDRNNVNMVRAQEAYEDYLQRYPDHAQSGTARADLATLKRDVVNQQLAVAEYYLTKMKDKDAAIFCYQELLQQESVNPQAAAKAKMRLKELGAATK